MEGVSSHSSNFRSKSNSDLNTLYFNARSLLPPKSRFLATRQCRTETGMVGVFSSMCWISTLLNGFLPSHASLELLTVALNCGNYSCHCFIVLLAHQLILCILFIVILSQLTFLSSLVLYSLVTLTSPFLTLLTLLSVIFVIDIHRLVRLQDIQKQLFN